MNTWLRPSGVMPSGRPVSRRKVNSRWLSNLLDHTVAEIGLTPTHQLTEGWGRTEFVDVGFGEILGSQLGSNIGFTHAGRSEHVGDSVVSMAAGVRVSAVAAAWGSKTVTLGGGGTSTGQHLEESLQDSHVIISMTAGLPEPRSRLVSPLGPEVRSSPFGSLGQEGVTFGSL